MFLNIDSFTDKKVLFNREDDFFTVDGERMPFSSISAFYCSSTDYFTNHVYEGNSLRITLEFGEGMRLETYEVDSNHREHYRLLHLIADAIAVFRREKLMAGLRNDGEIFFAIYGHGKSLHLKDTELYLGEERVGALAIDTGGKQSQFEFELSKRQFCVNSYRISDSALFLELVARLLPVTRKAPSRLERLLGRAFVGAVLILGVNGWVAGVFDAGLLRSFPLFEGLSTVAGIVLALWVVLRPFFWLVRRFNAGRMARRLELGAGMDGEDGSRVKD
jgi:hypothetical protein